MTVVSCPTMTFRRVSARSTPWILFATLASCGGTHHDAPTVSTASPAPIVRLPIDPALADSPADAVVVVRVDANVVRRSSYFPIIQQLAASSSLVAACDNDPLAQIAHLTAAMDAEGGVSVVVRGPVTDESHATCADALGTMFHLGTAPPARIRDALLYAHPSRLDIARAALEGGPNAAANPVLAILRRNVTTEGISAYVEFEPVRRGARTPATALPGLDVETMRGRWNGFAAGDFSVTFPGGNALAVDVLATFDTPEHARQARTWLANISTVGLAQLRGQLDRSSLVDDPGTRDRAVAALDQLSESFHLTAEGNDMRATVALDAEGAGFAASLVVPAFTNYVRRGRTSEARLQLAALSRDVAAYAMREPATPSRRRAGASPFPPSAPRTPATVPAGVAVVDPPGTWSHATWQALGFSIEDPHRYSYEFVNRRTSFSIRAYGDLDGDGTLSTFERNGRMNARQQIEFEPLRLVNETE